MKLPSVHKIIPKFNGRPCPLAALFGLALCVTSSSSQAANVVLTASNTLGTTSFNTSLSWSNGAAPSIGNDYSTQNFTLRTPDTGGSATFAGNSLTVNSGGSMLFKNGSNSTFTFNTGAGAGLVLSGGSISHAGTGGTVPTIAGQFLVTSSGGTLAFTNNNINISAPTTLNGALKLGAVAAGGNSVNAVGIISGNVGFGAAGKINMISSTTEKSDLSQSTTSTFNFSIGSTPVGTTFISGGFDNQITFNGKFAFDTTGLTLTLGNSWNIVNPTNLVDIYSATFSVPGFTESSNLWTSDDGNFQFSETTGVLSVVAVPEPSAPIMLVLGLIGLCLIRRRTGWPNLCQRR